MTDRLYILIRVMMAYVSLSEITEPYIKMGVFYFMEVLLRVTWRGKRKSWSFSNPLFLGATNRKRGRTLVMSKERMDAH